MRSRLLVALVAVASALQAHAVDPTTLTVLTIVNGTGRDMAYLFLSPSDSDSWGADALGSGRNIPVGGDRRFYLDIPEGVTEWDLLAVDVDRDAYIMWRAAIEPEYPVTIVIGADEFESGYDLPPLARVEIQNGSPRDIWFAFLRPDGAPALGADVLYEGTILRPGERYSVFVPVGSEPVRYELRAVHDDGTVIVRELALSTAQIVTRVVLRP